MAIDREKNREQTKSSSKTPTQTDVSRRGFVNDRATAHEIARTRESSR